MPFKTLFLVLLASTLVCTDQVLAQPTIDAESTSKERPAAVDYQLGPGDLLSIRVSGLREFDQSVHVSNSGRIRVPYVGIMFVAGMSASELEAEIAQKIRDHELVNAPKVRVQVEQHRAQPVHIVGEVTTPGQFVMAGDMYLLDLISRAGGLTASADGTGILYRRAIPRPSVTARVTAGPAPLDAALPPTDTAPVSETGRDAQVIPVNLDDLRDGTRPELNIPLHGGDVLYIPRRLGRTFYIIGDVTNPGVYMMPRRGDVSVTQAIIYAGGPLLTAKNGSAFLMRHDENGVRQAIPVHFIDIIKGKKPDIKVKEDDIIFIPNSLGKTIGVALFNLIPRLLQQFLIF